MLKSIYMENKSGRNLINDSKNETEISKQKMATLFKKHLMSPAAKTIKYDGKDRAGYEKVVCGHSPDGQISFVVRGVYHSDFVPENHIGLKRRDYFEVVFIDRKNKTDGSLMILKSDNERSFISSTFKKDLSDFHIEFWDEGGGLRYHPIGPEMKASDIQKISEILISGIDDEVYTVKALKKLNEEFPHTQVVDNLLPN
jgi:hypothetical protein